MIMILLSSAVMLVVLTLLTRPLWQKKLSSQTLAASAVPLRTIENADAYRARLLEIELALQTGRISAIEKQNLEIELNRTLLADAELSVQVITPDAGPQWRVAAVVALILTASTITGYWYWGDYQNALTWQQTQQRLQSQIDKALADPSVLLELFKTETTRDVILSYQQSLLRTPINPPAWQALSRILQSLEQGGLAQQAARKAYQQAPHEPGYALELAQLIIESNQGKLTPESDHLLKVLQKEHPHDPRVLMLLGMTHLKSAQWSQALSALQSLQSQLADVDMGEQGPLVKQKIADYIAQAQQGLVAAASSEVTTGPAAPAEPVASIDSAAPAATAVNLQVQVSIDPAALSSWKGTETLWVFAKAPDGPRFPVAAKKMVPTQWPVIVTLSDADAMMPQFKLSGFPQVTITARLSDNDSVMGSQPGDWQKSQEQVDPHQTKPIELILAPPP